jgi:ADP-ribose pyrophosphatase YjhB (NUDIX family)
MHTERPQVAIVAAVLRDGKILLQKRTDLDAWAMPGGHLESFETLAAGVLRELREEAGSDLQVSRPEFWTIVNSRFFDLNRHYVVIFMIMDWMGGEVINMEPDKNSEWGWFSWDDIPLRRVLGLQTLLEHNINPFNYRNRNEHWWESGKKY